MDPRELARSDAVQLFKDRAIKVRPSFTLPADTTPAVAEVCRRLDGLPLAIELAAARVTVLPASHIAEALDDRFRLLMATGWQAPPRQKSLRAAVDWSYGLLSNDERALFDQLSVFTGGCSLTEAERVGEQLGLGRFELLDLLGGLVEKSMLLTTEGADGQPRYRMLETLRAYGVEQLRALGRYDLACRRHAELFAALAATSEPQLFGPEHLHWLHRLEEELDNFRAALKYALDRGAADVAVRVAGALGFFFALTGRHTEGRARLQAALAAAGESTNTVDRAQALTYIGYLEGQQSDFERGIEDAERGLALAVASSDGWQIAKSRFILALTLGEAGRNDRTPQLLAKARADFDSIADPRADAGVAACDLVAAVTAAQAGDLVAAEHANREVLIRSQRIGYHLFEAWSRVLTAWIGVQRGKLAIADAELSRAWELVRQLGQSHHIAFVLTLRGRLAMQAGDFDRARSLLTTAVQTVDAIASPWFAALAREALAEAMQRSGNVDAAENLYSQALAVPPGAGAEFAALIVLFVGGSPAGRSLIGLGALARLRGRLAEAQQLQLQGVRRAKRDGDSAAVALGLEGLAASSADTWEIERAVLLLGAAESVRSAAGVATDPFGAAEATRVIAAASSAMTSEELERAIARGRRMRPEEALAAVHRA